MQAAGVGVGWGGEELKSKQFAEGALEEEDHGIIKAKLEGSLLRASAGGGPPHHRCGDALLPRSRPCGASPCSYSSDSTICRRTLCLPEPGALPSGHLSPAVGQPSLSPPA